MVSGTPESDLSNLVVFLATVSLASWAIVALTAVLRFVAFLRYRHRRSKVAEVVRG